MSCSRDWFVRWSGCVSRSHWGARVLRHDAVMRALSAECWRVPSVARCFYRIPARAHSPAAVSQQLAISPYRTGSSSLTDSYQKWKFALKKVLGFDCVLLTKTRFLFGVIEDAILCRWTGALHCMRQVRSFHFSEFKIVHIQYYSTMHSKQCRIIEVIFYQELLYKKFYKRIMIS